MATTKVTVKVDAGMCIGAAACVGSAPKLFRLDEDNIAVVVDPATGQESHTLTFEAGAEELQALREAVDNCPTSAISLT